MKKPFTFIFIFTTAVTGCATSNRATENAASRRPAQNLAQSQSSDDAREYQTSITCQDADTSGISKIKLSALSFFLVGPTAGRSFSDLNAAILRPFRSDGCSSSPDGVKPSLGTEPGIWRDCCIRHDASYWLGGTATEKESADKKLKQCISKHGYSKVGKLYEVFTDKFGSPSTSTIYRWGYGWNRKRPFGPVSASELQQVQILYGLSREQIATGQWADAVLKTPYTLERACDMQDPVFSKLSTEESLAYAYLNANLPQDDSIEWAKWGYFNLDRRVFEVKLKACVSPVAISFDRRLPILIDVQTECFTPATGRR